MKYPNETSCDNPFIGRLSNRVVVYKEVFIITALIGILCTFFLWFKGRKTFSLQKSGCVFFICQFIFAAFYLCFSLIFIIDEPSPLTSCSASVFFHMCYHLLPVPALSTLFSLICRSKYNAKLIEYFSDEKLSLSPLAISQGQYAMTTETNSTSSKELQRLKYLSSNSFYFFSVIFHWCLWGVIIFILERVICKGWITGNKCALDEFGLVALETVVLIICLFSAVAVIRKTLKYENNLELKSLPKNSTMALTFGIIPGIILPGMQILYYTHWYETSDEINLFPFILDDIAFISLFFSLFYPVYFLPFKTKSLDSCLDSDGLTLQDILNNDSSKAIFQAFLVETFCVENLLFIRYLKNFKQGKSKETYRLAHLIFKKFVAEGSLVQINISARLRKQVAERIYSNNIYPEMFQEVEQEVVSLLTYDSLPKFKSSNYYSQVVHHYLL
eukprot:snap_masked-scaffold_27-processed-gene-3.14-mRNA-1 protein AED:1.00 eAED:1.00 QI:0/-1/0/0/-1/1/1/0/443